MIREVGLSREGPWDLKGWEYEKYFEDKEVRDGEGEI